MKNFTGARWSGGSQLFWRGGDVGDTLEFEVEASSSRDYTLESVFTVAPDYAIIQLLLDGKALGDPIDLYEPRKVAITGVLSQMTGQLTAGKHKLAIRITGTNPSAAPARYVGLDFVKLVPVK